MRASKVDTKPPDGATKTNRIASIFGYRLYFNRIEEAEIAADAAQKIEVQVTV